LDSCSTQFFKQELSQLSKQVVSTITSLINRDFISKSEACEVEAPKSSTIMPGLFEISL
jgi:hypothetical protein